MQRLAALACLLTLAACPAPGPEAGPQGEVAEKQTEAPLPPPSAAELRQMYLAAKTRAEGEVGDGAFRELERDLRLVADHATDAHLRANASLLLGSLHEGRGDLRSAISFYEQARVLVDEPETVAVLALALAGDGQWARAIELQRLLIERVPDDLEARLLLGEMLVKAGQKEESVEAYAAYELRRKGLIDGLTATNEDGTFVVGPEERAACARALAPAADNGTALVLLTALRIEPDPMVRVEVVAAMGQQRLRGYEEFLKKHLTEEKEPPVREAMEWALGEIARDPIDARPAPTPEGEIETAAEEESKRDG